MPSQNDKYVARAEAGVGWRIWNRRTRRPWGNYFADYPEALLRELNGPARPAELTRLAKSCRTKTQVAKGKHK